MSTVLDGLEKLVKCSRSAEDLALYGRDWTRVHQPAPSAVVWPRHTEEVAAVLAYCNANGVAVVPSGGRTGLAAGAVATAGEVVLSSELLRGMGEVDRLGLTLKVSAGTITHEVHEHAREWGLTWPIDLGSKGSCHVGGNLATNAGGVRVIRYGHARHWVTGLEVVLMDGTVLDLGGGLHKDNSGPELRQLMIGSEGILGVITGATLKLTPEPRGQQVLLFAVESVQAAVELLSHARLVGRLELLAFEFLSTGCMESVIQVQHRPLPFSAPAPGYVLVEVEGALDEALETWLETVLTEGLVADGVLARTSAERRSLWGYRENITESLGHLGLMHKNDVSVEVARLPEFVQGIQEAVAPHYPGAVFLFGHLGDGNLHVNVMKPQAMEPATFWESCRRADVHLYQLLAALRGSISAEHGIGLLKKHNLHFTSGLTEIDTMRRIKRALDPSGLLNPGKVFDL